MASKAAAMKLADKHGIQVLIQGWQGEFSYDLDAPKGIKFGNDLHVACGSAEKMNEIWDMVIQDIQGIEECSILDCAYCLESN